MYLGSRSGWRESTFIQEHPKAQRLEPTTFLFWDGAKSRQFGGDGKCTCSFVVVLLVTWEHTCPAHLYQIQRANETLHFVFSSTLFGLQRNWKYFLFLRGPNTIYFWYKVHTVILLQRWMWWKKTNEKTDKMTAEVFYLLSTTTETNKASKHLLSVLIFCP